MSQQGDRAPAVSPDTEVRPEAQPDASLDPTMSSADTVVLGLGNPVLGDDAAGLHVAALVERLLQQEPVEGIRVVTSTRGGFELIDLLRGATRAVIVDCLAIPHGVPGTIRELTLQDVSGSSRLVGAHDVSLAVAFELAAALNIRMPERVEIYGIEAADTQTVTEELTPAVAAAAEALAARLYARLKAERQTAACRR